MATPTRDGVATGISTGSNSVAATLTTSNTNDVIVAIVGNESTSGSTATVSSVTATGLTFVNRSTKQVTYSGSFSGPCNFEIWVAPSTGALTSKVITANLSGSVDGAAIIVFGVNGAHDINNPWDSNGGLTTYTAVTSGNGTVPNTTTSQAHDYAFFCSFTLQGTSGYLVNSGPYSGSNFASARQTAGTNFATLEAHDASFSTVQTGTTTGLSGASGLAIVGLDAITGDTTSVNATVNLVGVSASAAVGTFAAAASASVSLAGVSATAHAGTVTPTVSVTFPLVGISATAQAGTIFPVTNFLTIPITTIMNDKPIPVTGTMLADPIPNVGILPYQLPLEYILNANPIPMTGTMMNVPVPGEGSVP